MDVTLAQPRGFCAGVVRAIDIVDRALDLHEPPIYVFHEIVHNGHVVADLRRRGAVFVNDVREVPPGGVLVFSAHGVALRVVEAARRRGLRIIDATCPLVAKVHAQARRYRRLGRALVMIGHAGHEEVEGTIGSVDGPVHLVTRAEDVAELPAFEGAVAYVTQTTLSVDDTRAIIATLRQRYPGIEGPDTSDICYATQNRQAATRSLASTVDLVLVVGARNSSNSNRLCEVAREAGAAAHLVADATDIDAAWLVGVARVGVTAGASAPEYLVTEVTGRLRQLGATRVVEQPGLRENVTFRLPPELTAPVRTPGAEASTAAVTA
jgi:4-hydroxy-3-methylbut-2-enyl diphosphate reductase